MDKIIRIYVTTQLVVALLLLITGCGDGNSGKIVFRSRSESGTNFSYQYSMNPDGSNLERLTYWYPFPMPYHNIWSADGKVLACVEYFEDTQESWLSVIDTDTGIHQRLLAITDLKMDSMALSPDGKTIILSADSTRVTRLKTPKGNTVHVEIITEPDMDLFTVNVETKELKRLTDTPDVMEKWPSYSPDGKQIAFVGRIDTESMKNVPRDVFILDSDGSNNRLLAHHTKGQFVFNPDFRWSPDGGQIAYHFYNNSLSDNDHYTDVFVIEVKKGYLTNLTNSPFVIDYEPVWSPDNQKIAYRSGNMTRGIQTIIINLHDGQVESFDTRKSSTSWTPDSKGFIFTNPRNVFELMVIDTDSQNLRTLIVTEDIRISDPVLISR